MVFANLSRRKGRTILTVLGISIGVAAIVALGAVARGLEAGFVSMTRGSEADLVLSQAGTLSSLLSSVDEAVGDELRTWPEVSDVAGLLFGNVLLGSRGRNFFVLGHEPESFAVTHFRIIEGQDLASALEARGTQRVRGTPLILGLRAAESLDKTIGDTVRLGGAIFRVVGIYETGDGLEDAAAVVSLQEAQALTLQSRRVSMFYIKLRSPDDADRLREHGILYAPDFVANAGGAIAAVGIETRGWAVGAAEERLVAAIAANLEEIFAVSATEGISTAAAALRLAEARLAG